MDNLDDTLRQYVDSRPLSYFQLREDITDVYDIILNDANRLSKFSLLGFTTYSTNIFFTFLAACLLKQKSPDIKIVFGGPQTTQSHLTAEIALRTGIANVICTADGEESFRQVIEANRDGKPLSVAGTVTYDSNLNVVTKIPAPSLNIHELVCPDFSGIDLNRYKSGNHTLPLFTSRGCPFSCEFCNEWKMWDRYRRLKTDKVIGWMKQLNADYGAVRFYMGDSLLNSSLPWIEEFADKIIQQDLPFQWFGYFRANMSQRLANKLKKAGVCRAFIGAESFDEDTLERMSKRATPDDNIAATEVFCSAGIPLEISNVISFPGESENEFSVRKQYYHELGIKHLGMFVLNCEPFQFAPGSGVYKDPQKFGIEIDYWSQEVVDAVPEISDVVKKLPMSITSTPGSDITDNWYRTITNMFKLDGYSALNFAHKTDKETLKLLIGNLNCESKVVLNNALQLKDIKSNDELVPSKFKTLKYASRNMTTLNYKEAAIFKALKSMGQIKAVVDHYTDRVSADASEEEAIFVLDKCIDPIPLYDGDSVDGPTISLPDSVL